MRLFSAYTGGLWLSALKCTIKIAELLELKDSVMKYHGVLERGKRAFERKLWNGNKSFIGIENFTFCNKSFFKRQMKLNLFIFIYVYMFIFSHVKVSTSTTMVARMIIITASWRDSVRDSGICTRVT